MSGASTMGGMELQKARTDFDRRASALPPRFASPADPSIAGVQDANEIFRQSWQKIVGSFEAAEQGGKYEQGGKNDATVLNPLQQPASVPVSVQGPAALSPSSGLRLDRPEIATTGLDTVSPSTAESTLPRPVNKQMRLPAQAAAHAEHDRSPAKASTEHSTSRVQQSSIKSSQASSQWAADIQNTTAIAPYSQPVIAQANLPKPAAKPITDDMLEAKLCRPESSNGKEEWASAETGSAEPAGVMAPFSGAGQRPTVSTPVDPAREEKTPSEIRPSDFAPVHAVQSLDAPDDHVPTHKLTSAGEHPRSSTPDTPPPRPSLGADPKAAHSSEISIEASDTILNTLDQGVQINQTTTSPEGRAVVRRDHAGIAAASSSYAKARTAAAPSNLNQPISDGNSIPFGQMRGASLSASSAASSPTSQAIDESIVPHGKTASVRETFAAMDAEATDGSARWILADSHRAEAGFQDPALGWISVRAHAGATGIHATVMPSSETAAEVLSSHLAGLNSHMANQYEHMNAVTLSVAGTDWKSHGTGSELAQENHRGSNEENQQQTQQNSEPMPSEPVRHFTKDIQDERMSVDAPVFTRSMSLDECHFSVVV